MWGLASGTAGAGVPLAVRVTRRSVHGHRRGSLPIELRTSRSSPVFGCGLRRGHAIGHWGMVRHACVAGISRGRRGILGRVRSPSSQRGTHARPRDGGRAVRGVAPARMTGVLHHGRAHRTPIHVRGVARAEGVHHDDARTAGRRALTRGVTPYCGGAGGTPPACGRAGEWPASTPDSGERGI